MENRGKDNPRREKNVFKCRIHLNVFKFKLVSGNIKKGGRLSI